MLEIYGKLHEKGERQELIKKDGEAVKDHFGRAMEKMNFVIRLKSSKETYVQFETMKTDILNFMGDTAIGTELRVGFNAESRKWNDRWFTSLKAFECEVYKVEEDELRFPKGNSKEAVADMMRTDRKNKPLFDNNGDIDDNYDSQLPF